MDTQAAGLIEMVVAVMRAQPADANAQEQGCGALYDLVYDRAPANLEAARAASVLGRHDSGSRSSEGSRPLRCRRRTRSGSLRGRR